jgi:hypothetical protein
MGHGTINVFLDMLVSSFSGRFFVESDPLWGHSFDRALGGGFQCRHRAPANSRPVPG